MAHNELAKQLAGALDDINAVRKDYVAMSEAEYLRRELIRAKYLLASTVGLLRATETVAPHFFGLTPVQDALNEIAEFQLRGVAVLPEGVDA